MSCERGGRVGVRAAAGVARTELSPCAHITAHEMTASSILVCRIRLSTAVASSRSSVTARRASEPIATLDARKWLTAPRAADHQWRCAAWTMPSSTASAATAASPRSIR